MSAIQDKVCYRIRGTFLEFAMLSCKKEKTTRSHSAPPGRSAIAPSKEWYQQHDGAMRLAPSGQSGPAESCKSGVADKVGCGSTKRWCSVRTAPDGHNADIMAIAKGHNTQSRCMKNTDQCPCCGEHTSVCACDSCFLPQSASLYAEVKGRPNIEEDSCEASAPEEEQNDYSPDTSMPKLTNDGRTVMLCNIPCRIGRKDIADALVSHNFGDLYNFIHLPKGNSRRYRRNGNIGYCFINFVSKDVGYEFAKVFEGFQFPGMRSAKKCTVSLAHQQGINGKEQE